MSSLRKHQHQRNLLFQNCLLNEPHHIQLLSVTASKYDLLDDIFHSLGNIEKSISDDEIQIQGDFNSLCKGCKENHNCFLSETLEKQLHLRDLSSSFIIPSSNPDSPLPEHLCDWDFNDGQKILENDSQEDDNGLKLKKALQTDSQDMLEEIESLMKLDDLKLIPSSSATLSKKLKPVRVTDPFLMRFEPQLSIISGEREFSQVCFEGYSRSIEEEIDQHLLSFEDDLDGGYVLEETICFHSSVNYELDNRIELIPADRSGLAMTDVGLEDECIEKIKAMASGIVLSIKDTEDLTYPKKESEETDDLHVLCGGYGNNWKTDNVTLESPVHCSIFSTNTNALDSLRTSAELLPNEISPLRGRNFLSTPSKAEMEMMLRDKDKTLGETLSMTLKVPETHELQYTPLVPLIRDKYSLFNQSMNCGLEVSLPWDPFSLQRHEIIESKSTLHSELRLCLKHTMSDGMPDDDLKTIRIDDSAECSSNVLACELAIEKTCSDFSTKKMNKSTSESHFSTKDKLETTSGLSISQRLNRIQHLVIKDINQPGKSNKNSMQQLDDSLKGNILKNAATIASPLDSFILLRTGRNPHNEPSSASVPVAMVPPRSMVKAAKVKPLPLHTEQSPSTQGKEKSKAANGTEREPTKLTPAKSEKLEEFLDVDNCTKSYSACSKMKREIISVEMSTVYQVIIDRLEKDSRPLLRFLKERKVISQDHQFCNMKPDLTRFLIRQQEKRHENSTINAHEEDIMKGVICLHALVLSSDAIINYGILAAVGILEVIKEKYDEFVGDLLESVRQYLLKEQRKAGAKHQLHPKIQTIAKMVNESLCIPGTKVLILVRRYFDCCFQTLEETLSSLERAVILRYPRGIVDERPIFDLISKGNVIVAALSSELQFCPWNCISCVFEFEHRDESEWYQLCFEENANLKGFYALDSVTMKCSRDEGRDSSLSCKEITPDQGKPMKVFSEHIVIGSRKVTQNQDLLYELENKLNIALIERDYSQLYDLGYSTKCCLQPDITVDERTCIVIISSQEIAGNADRQMPQSIFSSMKMKCLECYIILTVLELDVKSSILFDIIEDLSQVLLPSLQARNTNHETKFHLLYAFSQEETAEWILLICNQAREASTVWNTKDWGNRFWLTEEMSLHEKFLLSLPCFTSFTAQIVLTAAPLRKILGLELEEMRNVLVWLPDKTIQAFYASVNEDKFEDTFVSAQFMDRDNFALNMIDQNDLSDTQITSKQEQERFDYEPYTASIHCQQYSSLPDIHQSMDNIHTSKFITRDRMEQSKMGYVGHPLSYQFNGDPYAKSFIKGDISLGKADLMYTGEIETLPAIVSNHIEDGLISERKEYTDMCLIHNEASLYDNNRQQNQLHLKDRAPKWKLVESTGNGSHWDHNNGASSVKSQRRQGWCSSLGSQKSVNKCIGTPSTVRLTPSKKRRLTFEKDPNSRNGQTRLSFV